MEFRAGRVLSSAISIFGRNIVGFLILGLVVYFPILAHGYWELASDDFLEIVERRSDMQVFWQLFEQVLKFFVQATVVYAVFEQIRGNRAPIGKAIRVGLARLVPVIGVVLLLGLSLVGAAMPGAILGYATTSPIVMLIGAGVPVVIVWIMFFVAVPVAVVERPGVMFSLKRSQELTEGHRWGIFGLFLVTAVLEVVVTMILYRGFLGDLLDASVTDLRIFMLLESALGLVFTLFAAVVAAVAYHDLRLEKDGVSVEELTAVFE